MADSARARPPHPAPSRGRRGWWIAIGLLPLGIAAAGVLSASDGRRQFDGVRLGMSATQVREAYTPAEPGEWSSSVSADGTLLLDWRATEGPSAARFEVHDGLLVAVRGHAIPTSAPSGDRVEVTADDVWSVSSDGNDTSQVLWIARNCPLHREEIDALVSGGAQALLVPAAHLE